MTGSATDVTYGMDVKTWTRWDGVSPIKATDGNHITVVEADPNYKSGAFWRCSSGCEGVMRCNTKILGRVKTRIPEDTVSYDLLEEYIQTVSDRLCLRLGTNELPKVFESICTDAVVKNGTSYLLRRD